MLPALTDRAPRLADVLKDSLNAVRGEAGPLRLPPVERAVVLLVDGLGAEALRARAGHARTLMSAMTSKSTIESGFPTTTAAALASLTTGVEPGQHGLVGYSVLDGANDRIVNQLSGWDARLDPATWQRVPTLFETATDLGIGATLIGPGRYSDSGFTSAVLRGGTYRAAESIADRLELAATVVHEPGGPGIVYVYVPELDMAGHAHGWQSPQWTDALEQTDGAVRRLVAALGPSHGLIVTADHGVVDVERHQHVLFDSAPQLVDGVRFVAGEPRCLQLHFDPSLSATERESLVAAWHTSEDARSWVVTRQEAIDAGWFGSVDPEVAPRIGDLLVAARKNIAYYDSRAANTSGQSMVGQHGSWSSAELRVPLLKFGAFRA